MNSPRPYLTISETAALLALSKRTIHRYIAEGKLPKPGWWEAVEAPGPWEVVTP